MAAASAAARRGHPGPATPGHGGVANASRPSRPATGSYLGQSRRLNWTGFSFHVTCGPPALSDWSYTPTTFWGAWAEWALAGERFELKRIR